MADTTANSTIVQKKSRRAAAQVDTIGGITTRTYTFTLANGTSEIADFKILGRTPAGSSLLGVYSKAANAITANCAIEWGISATANGASPSVAVANVANVPGVNTTWQPAATGAGAAACTTSEGYLVATFRAANNVVATTVTATAVFVGVLPDEPTYSTFTS
jgi:hypothetical protein